MVLYYQQMDEIKILVVDDEKTLLEDISDYLENYNITTFSDPRDALKMLENNFFHIIVVDYKMPGMSGVELLLEAKKMKAYTHGILFTAFADKDMLEQGINRKIISRFIEKPVRLSYLEKVIQEGIEECRQKEVVHQKIQKYESLLKKKDHEELIGLENGLKKVYEQVLSVATHNVSILLTGETGTGKEMIAKLIHNLSDRRNKKFVEVNCAAIPVDLLESELFGYIKGAFTGATSDKQGKIEQAHKGTLFLDEIGDMKPDLQAKLLRVLQDRKIQQLGSLESRDIDFRLIAATNKNLKKLAREKHFRDDLYYRVSTIPIHLPPLRERREDIIELVHYFVSKYTEEVNGQIKEISPGVLKKMENYYWPGNIRELMNAVYRSVIMGKKKAVLDLEDFDFLLLPQEITPGKLEKAIHIIRDEIIKNKTPLKIIEKKILNAILTFFKGKVGLAVKNTGISKDKFYRNNTTSPEEKK